MVYAPFIEAFGAPEPGSGVELSAMGLEGSEDLRTFAEEIGNGTFADGFLSVASVREQAADLDEWKAWLPPEPRAYASTAFGLLFILAGGAVWIVDTQLGLVVQSDLSVSASLLEPCKPSSQQSLRRPLFEAWAKTAGPLKADSVLCPTPALPLGGTWTAANLSVMSMVVYLSFMGQIYAPDRGSPARIIPLD